MFQDEQDLSTTSSFFTLKSQGTPRALSQDCQEHQYRKHSSNHDDTCNHTKSTRRIPIPVSLFLCFFVANCDLCGCYWPIGLSVAVAGCASFT